METTENQDRTELARELMASLAEASHRFHEWGNADQRDALSAAADSVSTLYFAGMEQRLSDRTSR